MFDTLIRNARIITMDDAAPIIDMGCIGIKNGKIAFIGKDEPPMVYNAADIIDARGNIILPGLINTHCHAAMSVLRGYADDYNLNTWLFDKIFPAEGRLTEAAVLSGVRLSAAEMLASGTTSFSDMYFFEPSAARVIEEIGIRASLGNGVTALSDDFDFDTDRGVWETFELIRDWHGAANGRIRADVSIHGEYTSRPDEWEKLASHASKHELVTQIHVSETQGEQLGCIERHGMTPVQILDKYGVFENRVLAAHGCWLTDEDMDILAKRGASVAHNPVSNLKLASGIARVSELLKRDINVSIGTDGCASNNNLDLFEEIKLASLLAKGSSLDPTSLPAYDALKLATVNGAYAQGREDEIGMLKVGYDSDLIMLDVHNPRLQPIYDPISAAVYAANGSDVCLTMVQGRILYKNGEWFSIDIERAFHDIYNVAVPLIINR